MIMVNDSRRSRTQDFFGFFQYSFLLSYTTTLSHKPKKKRFVLLYISNVPEDVNGKQKFSGELFDALMKTDKQDKVIIHKTLPKRYR